MRIQKRIIYVALSIICLLGYSCEYKEIADSDYPDGKVYMPIAYDGTVYTINDLTKLNENIPTPGEVSQYTVNKGENKFIVPLGVYRSGINVNKNIKVGVSINSTIIDDLIANGNLSNDVLQLPTDKYTLPAEVRINKNERVASFDLVVDFAFLRNEAPNVYVLGMTIASGDMEVSEDMGTIVVSIDTRMMLPVADFNAIISKTDTKHVDFSNSSKYGLSYLWDFGDGNTSSAETPSHTYAAAGSYQVKLSATGLYGDVVKLEKEVTITP